MSKRKLFKVAAWTFIVSLVLSIIFIWHELFSDESAAWKMLLLLGVFGATALIMGPAIYGFCRQEERNAERTRAIDEENKRREEAEERRRVYEENYQREGQVLKDRILNSLRAISRGEKTRLDSEALDAANALAKRQGDHPETLSAWAPILDDLRAASVDPREIQKRLDDLLHPDTLEDVQALKKRVIDVLERISRGEKTRLDPETLEATKYLNEIRERDLRIRREEDAAEAQARKLREASDRDFAATMDEMAKSSVRNILRMHGLPETSLDGLPPNEVLAHIRALRLIREFESEPDKVKARDA